MPKKAPKQLTDALASTKRRPKKSPKKAPAPWEPTPREFEWYRLWTVEYLSQAEVARRAKVTRQTMHTALHKVREYLNRLSVEELITHRQRQTEALEHIASQALAAWERSKKPGVTTTSEVVIPGQVVASTTSAAHSPAAPATPPDEKKTTKTENQCGDPSYLNAARSALADIREIWGVNAPKKLDATVDISSQGLERVAGMSRDDAKRHQAEMLLNSIQQEQNDPQEATIGSD